MAGPQAFQITALNTLQYAGMVSIYDMLFQTFMKCVTKCIGLPSTTNTDINTHPTPTGIYRMAIGHSPSTVRYCDISRLFMTLLFLSTNVITQ